VCELFRIQLKMPARDKILSARKSQKRSNNTHHVSSNGEYVCIIINNSQKLDFPDSQSRRMVCLTPSKSECTPWDRQFRRIPLLVELSERLVIQSREKLSMIYILDGARAVHVRLVSTHASSISSRISIAFSIAGRIPWL
jgi:hypothetical protein